MPNDEPGGCISGADETYLQQAIEIDGSLLMYSMSHSAIGIFVQSMHKHGHDQKSTVIGFFSCPHLAGGKGIQNKAKPPPRVRQITCRPKWKMPLIQDVISRARTLCSHPSVIAAFSLIAILILIRYRLKFHTTSLNVPGPFLARWSSLFLYTICYLGIEGQVLRYYHDKYKTKVLQVAPKSVSVSDCEAIRDIYITSGGFLKDARYTNFNLGPVVSIFSAIDTGYRDMRAKAVAPLFAPVRLRAASMSEGVIGSCVSEFVSQLQEFKIARMKVDILDLSARLSIDIVTGALLGQRYGGLIEDRHLPVKARQKSKLSANPFFFAIVAFSRFSLLPAWLFKLVHAVSSRLSNSSQVVKSFIQLDRFIAEVMNTAVTATKDPAFSSAGKAFSYPYRLLQAGVTTAEAAAQSKAIVFAGGDSTAVMLATILFHLVRNPHCHAHLLDEIRRFKTDLCQTDKYPAAFDSQSLPYLRAVIKEGLRLGMANPTRLTRLVPPSGFLVRDKNASYYLPPGTIVGCAAYILHHDEAVFPHPFEFHPERWLDDAQEESALGNLHRQGMERNMMPFGAGSRACIGKNLAQCQLFEAVMAVGESRVLEGARTCQEKIELVQWFNGEIKGHRLEIEWSD